MGTGNALDKCKDCDELEIDCGESGSIGHPESGFCLGVGRGTRIGKCSASEILIGGNREHA
jgi:hypothetical protein